MRQSWTLARYRSGAILLLTALLAGVGLAGAHAGPALASAPAAQGVASLNWGVKTSFRNYVTGAGLNPERITVAGGTSVAPDGTFDFPATSTSFDPATGSTRTEHTGSVRFVSHDDVTPGDYLLDLTISNPSVVISADEQVLTAEIRSRALDGMKGGQMVDYGRVALASLDISGASVVAEGGVTRWNDVRTAVVESGVPAFAGFYLAGTALDPVRLAYAGDGGKPRVTEAWTTPGTPRLEVGASNPIAFPSPPSSTNALHLDEKNQVLWTSVPDIHALDLATMRPLTDDFALKPGARARTALDPESGTLFVMAAGAITSLRYDRGTSTVVTSKVATLDPGFSALRNLVWNPRTKTLQALAGTAAATSLLSYSPDGAGSWREDARLLPAPPAGTSANNWYGSASTFNNISVGPDGSLLLARRSSGAAPLTTLRIRQLGDGVEASEIEGTVFRPASGDTYSTFGYSRITTDATGAYLVREGASDGLAPSAVLRLDLRDDRYVVRGEPLLLKERVYDVSVAPSGLVYLGAYDSKEILVLRADGQMSKHFLPDVFMRVNFPSVFDAAGSFYSMATYADGRIGVMRADLVARSPEVVSHPTSQSVSLGVEGSARARFEAAADQPDAEIQWQVRKAGSLRFVDLVGENRSTLDVAASRADNGGQYRAVVSNAAGATASREATLTVLTSPHVLAAPSNATVGAGGSAQFSVIPAGEPLPDITWQVLTATGWVDAAGPQLKADGAYLTVTRARADQDGLRVRARLTNVVGTVLSAEAVLTVTGDSIVPVPQEDGSIVGVKNPAGAHTRVLPGVEVPVDGASLTVTGRGFTKNTNEAGVYVLFGYMVTAPSAGATAGSGYDFSPGGGASGQDGQMFVAWPGNSETGAAATAVFTSTTGGEFSASGLFAKGRFTGQSGAAVDCLDGSVVCGVLTIGAHGGRDAALETFTPVYFAGQKIPEGPVVPPVAPVVTPPKQPVALPAATVTRPDGTTEGSLVWGVKQSFRSYVTGSIAKGSISVRDGASSQGGVFRFAQSSTDRSAGSGGGSTTYRGSVEFVGHEGILRLAFSDPVVRVDSASSGTLLARVNGGGHTAIGSLDLGAASRSDVAGGVSYANVPVTLTGDGAAVFSYGSSRFYSPGEAMDPLSFVVGVAGAPSPAGVRTVAAHAPTKWSPPSAPPARTGAHIDPEMLRNLRPGSEITASAEGFAPGEKGIKVVLYSEPVVLEEDLTADDAGRVSWTGLIPLTTEPGVHTLTFQGSVSRGIEITVQAPAAPEGCTVTDASLGWGLKESFRAYVAGPIAHGDWALSDGATYEEPAFGWSTGTGVFDGEAFTGQVSYPGAITFTGHDGLLSTTVARPTIVLTGPDTAYLLLDVAGVTMEDALAGDADKVATHEQVSFVELDLSRAAVEVSADGSQVTVDAAPTTLTAEGHAAFPNYDPGTEFDPVSFRIGAEAGCATPVPVTGAASAPEGAVTLAAPGAGEAEGLPGWARWAGAGLVVGAMLVVMIAWRIRRRLARERAAVVAEGPGAES
ncbi:HtaA domain-containing protein [Oerskovia turbata]